MSAHRMMSVSIRPPPNPATMPSGTPSTNPKTTEARPTSSDTRVPQMMRLRMSRPNSSVPSMCRSTMPGPLSTASENCADGLSGETSGAAAATTTIAAAISAPMVIGKYRRRCPRLAPGNSARVSGRVRCAGSARRTRAMVTLPALTGR